MPSFLDFLDNEPVSAVLTKGWALLHVVLGCAAVKKFFPEILVNGLALIAMTSVMLAIAELEIASRIIKRPLRMIELHDNKLFFIAFGLAYTLAIALFVIEIRDRANETRRREQRDLEFRQRVQSAHR